MELIVSAGRAPAETGAARRRNLSEDEVISAIHWIFIVNNLQ